MKTTAFSEKVVYPWRIYRHLLEVLDFPTFSESESF